MFSQISQLFDLFGNLHYQVLAGGRLLTGLDKSVPT